MSRTARSPPGDANGWPYPCRICNGFERRWRTYDVGPSSRTERDYLRQVRPRDPPKSAGNLDSRRSLGQAAARCWPRRYRTMPHARQARLSIPQGRCHRVGVASARWRNRHWAAILLCRVQGLAHHVCVDDEDWPTRCCARFAGWRPCPARAPQPARSRAARSLAGLVDDLMAGVSDRAMDPRGAILGSTHIQRLLTRDLDAYA